MHINLYIFVLLASHLTSHPEILQIIQENNDELSEEIIELYGNLGVVQVPVPTRHQVEAYVLQKKKEALLKQYSWDSKNIY